MMVFELHTFLTQHPIQWLPFSSALSGLIGTGLVFIFGVPNQIDTHGEGYLVLGQIDYDEIEKIKKYKRYSYLGLALIAFSFFLSVVTSI